MPITIATDKLAIQSVLSMDNYLTEYLGFPSDEIYGVRATDDILDDNQKKQIFVYNVTPEATINPIIHGIIYEIDVSVPVSLNVDADLAMDQILALLDGLEIANTHKLELIDPPMVLSSETSLYQVGIRFVCYEAKYNKPKTFRK